MVSRWLNLKGSPASPSIFPDFGPLEINSNASYLIQAKEQFDQKWDAALEPGKASTPNSSSSKHVLSDYKKIKIIGSGSFGKVFLVENHLTNSYFAMKCISKNTILKYRQLEHTKTEKLVLLSINCPFTLRMVQYFKDNSYIYFVVPFIQGGELYTHLREHGKLEEHCAMFYIAQVILAIEYLHFVDIVYRDIKPENILVDHTGYIKLGDFGFCKRLTKGRTYTLCGTPEYLAPEVILSKGYGKAVDWWGVGILTYELASGETPFREKKAMKIYENILKGLYKMPSYFSVNLKDLLRNTLQADLSKRFGNLKNGTTDFKDHKWFRTINWQAVGCRKFIPPMKPKCEGQDDIRYFRLYDYESLDIATEEQYTEEFKDF